MYTFLFTDIEGSTTLWEQHPKAMSLALIQHDAILNRIIKEHHGKVFKTVGDAFYAVFEFASEALQSSLEIQRELFTTDLPVRVRVRMALHTGEAEQRGDDYFGASLNRVARIESAANGGQILLSESVAREIDPQTFSLRNLGIHRLRSLPEPIQIYQLIIPDVPLVSTPIKTQTPHPSNLPAQLTSFVGRETEVQSISAMMRQKSLRLVTLIGTGGIGKTRLSLQIGQSLLDDFQDGVFFVNLSLLETPKHLLTAIAEVLDLREEENLWAEVKAYLQDKQLLLILDNFEHLLDVAPTVNELLSIAPRLKVLATSREALSIYGEQIYNVRPLGLPDMSSTSNSVQIASYPAVALFIERVQSAQVDFILDDDNAADVATICQQLEGLPLALELAAARASNISLADIKTQLKSRLEVLNSSYRDLPARQRTMRGAIQWSYDLLSVDEQQIFMSLGVFVGNFSQSAAQAVSESSEFSSLVNKSLLNRNDEQNLMMLAVLREFALEKQIETDKYENIHQRYADYYLDQIELSEPHLTGLQQSEWFSQLRFAYPNIRVALNWLLSINQIEKAARLSSILWRYWLRHSQMTEGLSWLNQVLVKSDTLPDTLQAKILHGAGRLSMFLSNYTGAKTLYEASLKLYRTGNDPIGQAMTLLSMGENETFQDNLIEAEQYLSESFNLHKAADDLPGMSRSLDNLGNIALNLENLDVAQHFLTESLMLERQRGSTEGLARILNNLAEMTRSQERYDEATAYYEESLAIYRTLDLSIGVAVVLHNLGQIALCQEQYPRASELFREALRSQRDLEEQQVIAECLAGLGSAILYTQDNTLSVRLYSASESLLNSLQSQLEPVDELIYQQHKQVAMKQLDSEAWKTAWAEGAAMPLAQIFESAISG